MEKQATQMQAGLGESEQTQQSSVNTSEASSPPTQSPTPEPEEQSASPSPESGNPLPAASRPSSAPRPGPSPPAADTERHPKGKRKRTTAKDKAILEAAYNANPKPDKAARLEIVKRVDMNEKEVQIWFQNRRQNDRRKSRPLTTQEIAAMRYGGMQVVSHEAAPYNSSFCSDNSNPSPSQAMPVTEHTGAPPSHVEPANPPPADDAANPQVMLRDARQWEAGGTASAKESVASTPYEKLASESGQMLSRSFPGSVGYLANRWNTASSLSTPTPLHRDASFRHETCSSSCSPSASSGSAVPLPVPRPSRFRLSMSLDGKAEVVPSIPSPPRPTPAPPSLDSLEKLPAVTRPELYRRHSTSAVSLPPFSELASSLLPTNSGPLPPRLTRGRSRDVHAWEFCCDSENREDALTAQAKHESRGSAIAAISLLRSTSSTGGASSPLQPSSSSAKRNAAVGKAVLRGGMAKRPRLSKASSSLARLQTVNAATTTTNALGVSDKHNIQRDSGKLTGNKPKPTSSTALSTLSGHDSDKENWSPDEDGNPRPSFRAVRRGNGASMPSLSSSGGRRPLPSSPSRLDRKNPRRTPARQFMRGGSAPFLAGRAHTAPTRGLQYQQYKRDKRAESPLEIYEDDVGEDQENDGGSASSRPVLDDEVERFMRGDVSPSKKGDADAVAGLLSLSQGNWR
ncbi:hypothetical protein VTK26DRAFT_2370 [Humicola hyalothermophila]